MSLIVEEQTKPYEWEKAIILPTFKYRGSKLVCGNYKGINLISVPSNVFMRLMLDKIKSKIEDGLQEEQGGFTGERSTVIQIIGLRQV